MKDLHQVKIFYYGKGERRRRAQLSAGFISMEKFRIDNAREINKRIDELAREYDAILPGEPRREEIASEISQLQLRLQYLQKKNV